jgi:hypothetical protein
MDMKEKAGWLADKICNGGDYAKESAAFLIRLAEEVEYWRQLHRQDVATLKDELKLAEEKQRFCFACASELYGDAEQLPTNQNWKGVDGAIAWHLIDRHADGWTEIGKMMDEWLTANQLPNAKVSGVPPQD